MKRKKLLTLLAAAMMLFGGQSANASVKLTALSGSNWDSGNEGPKALVDEQTNSKWGTWDGNSGNPVYVVLKSSAAIAPKSYELITANDTNNNTGRSWSQWKIYGGNFASDAEATLDATGWVEIDSKTDQSLDKSQYAVNKKDISGTIASGTYYTYFKIVVEALEGGWGNYCQMDGFRFTNVKFAPQDVTFTCTAGKNYNTGEGIDKMFDLDCNTKYCNNAGSDCYALVTASEPVFVWGYDLTTANDNNGGRKVTKWSLYGTNDETVAKNPDADGWVTLSNMDKNGWIEGKNWYTQRFFCNKGAAGTAYKYFKVTLDDGGFIQLSEFRFCYDTHRVVTYNWTSGPSDAAKKAFDGKPDPKWEGGNGDFVGKSFTIETADGESYAVKKYHFTTNDDGGWQNRAPKSWTIEGSNDNSSWTTIAEVDDKYAIHNANFTTYEFTPSNTTDAFRYVKLTINNMKGTGWSQIGDFQVLAVSEVSDKDYYTNMVNNATSFERGSLSESDPWYVEYKDLCDDADAVLEAAISSGQYDPVVTIVEKLNYYVSLLTELKDGANYVAFDGTATWGDGHWKQLFDGKDGREGREGTKWGAHFASDDAKQYVIFRVREAFKPFFYKLVTGGDTNSYKGRNWKTWNVYGANFAALADATYDPSKWTKLDAREDITEEYLPFENNYPASFNFNQYPDGLPESYLYYMVEVIDSYTRSQGTQMNEMALCTQAEFDATRDPLVAEFDDFDTTREVEDDMEDEMDLFAEKFAALKTTADAVEMTKLYNQCVALRAALESSMAYMDLLNNADVVNGVYQLGTPEALNYFSIYVNRGNPSLNAVLIADIDMTGKAYTPIGTDANRFVGSFDGQGHSITLDINNPEEQYQGLFGHADGGASFSNLIIKGTVIGANSTAALVGEVRGSGTINISRVGCEATVTSEGHHIGAFVGNDWGYSVQLVIENSYNAGNITGANPTCVIGGAIKGESTFTNVYNTGAITVTDGSTDKFSQYNYGTCTNCYTTEAGTHTGLTTGISAEMIASGELCYLLNGDQSSIVFYQTIGTDGTPTLDSASERVYIHGTACPDSGTLYGDITYSNTEGSLTLAHSYDDGFCSYCGALQSDYMAATDGYYLIGTLAQFKWFVAYVNAGNTSANAKLTADIDYSSYTGVADMIGDNGDTRYAGTFDGQGHTVTVGFINESDIENSSMESGLFRRISGATIQNLKVAGTITTNQKFAGGIAARVEGNACTITNCESAVTISDSGSGDATHGGILACANGSGFTVENCLFSGSIDASNREGCGGVVGWAGSGTKSITNCLVTGTMTVKADGSVAHEIIVRNGATCSGNYYYGTYDGINLTGATEATAAQMTSGELCYILNGGSTDDGTPWTQTIGTDANPIPLSTSQKVHQASPNGYTNLAVVDSKTQIATGADLKKFATEVNAGNTAVDAVLTDDINLNEIAWTPIGNGTNKYTGTFDGQNYDISNFSLNTSDQYSGLFGVIDGATVKDFSISGEMETTGSENGVVAWAEGASVVSGIHSSLDITVNDAHSHNGGVVGGSKAVNESTLLVENCEYSGTLTVNGSDADVTGGIIGYTYVGTIRNCIFNGTINGNVDNKPYGGILGYCANTNFGGIQNCLVLGKIVSNAENTTASILIGKWNSNDVKSVSNNYYLPNAGSSENVGLVGGNTANVTAPVEVDAAQLASGEVCAKLGDAFTQVLNKDDLPTLDSSKPNVYEIAVSEAGYATFVPKKNIAAIPEGVDAFAAQVMEGYVHLEKVTELPANNAVVVKATAGNYYCNSTNDARNLGQDNDLQVAPAGFTATGTQYILANGGNGVGFYRAEGVITEGKGYIVFSGASSVKGFFGFEADDATGISEVENGKLKVESSIYNVAGQRIQKMQKGINIMNGKKIMK